MGNDLTPQPALVTGAAGYLGQRVLIELQRRGVSAVGTTTRSGMAFACDLTDPDAVRHLMNQTGAVTIFHCAARVPKNDAAYSDEQAAHDSLRMVTNLLAARPRHIIFPSSMTVYRAGTRVPVCEEDAAGDLIGYARGKKTAEDALLGVPEVKATVLRFPGLFGSPRRSGFIYKTALAFAENRIPQLSAQPPLWAAMHVEDAAELCVRAAARESSQSMVLNAGYPGRMSLCSVLRDLARIYNRHAPECAAPEFEMDLSRLRRELGMPSHELADRLRDLAVWARQHARSEVAR